MESFEDAEKGINKSWVKGGVVNPEKGNDVHQLGVCHNKFERMAEFFELVLINDINLF